MPIQTTWWRRGQNPKGKGKATAPDERTCNAVNLLGKPYTISCISHGLPLRVRTAPATSSPLCCLSRRGGSGVDPT